VVSQFRAYLEKLDKIVPAVGNTASATPLGAPPIVEGVPTTGPQASDVAATAQAVPSTTASTMPNRTAKSIPPFDIIGKAKTYTLRGKGPAGEQGTFDRLFGVGTYGNLQSAMADIDQQMRDWHRMEYVEEVSKADLVILVYQWDERAYSRQFHGVRSAIQIAEGGVQFQRGDPALWVSGTVDGSTKDLIAHLRYELDRFPPAEVLEATHVANKDYNRGCDRIDSAEEKTGEQRSDLLFEAIAELRKSLRADYGYAPAHERLAAALRQLGFDSNAVYEYNLALQLQPSMQEALDGLASEGFPH
jgi:tetratricopeptide (TPR) repeat protein